MTSWQYLRAQLAEWAFEASDALRRLAERINPAGFAAEDPYARPLGDVIYPPEDRA